MKLSEKVIKLLSFKLEYKTAEELKMAAVYFFGVFVFLRLLAVGLNQSQFFSLVLTIGALVYLSATLHFVHSYIHKAYPKKYKHHLKLYDAVFAVVQAILIIIMVYLMFAPITLTAENTVVSLIVSLLLIILPASFSDEIIEALKKTFKPALLLLPAAPNLSNINLSQAQGIAQGIQNAISGKLPNLASPFPYGDVLNNIISQFGLPTIIIVVVIALFVLKIIKTLLQLFLVIIIIWAVVKYLGII